MHENAKIKLIKADRVRYVPSLSLWIHTEPTRIHHIPSQTHTHVKKHSLWLIMSNCKWIFSSFTQTHTHTAFHHQHLESTYLHNNKQHTHKRHFISEICLKIPRHCVHTNHAWFIARTKIFNCTLAVKILCKCMRNYSNTIRNVQIYMCVYICQQNLKQQYPKMAINDSEWRAEKGGEKKAIFNREQIYVCLICLHSLILLLLLLPMSFLYCCWRVNSHDNK
jgi:hypothetical protein